MKKAIILNAGEGKRLRPLTDTIPKCLLKLNGVTILEHQLTNLAKCGIRDIVLVVGYLADHIIRESTEKSLGMNIKFIHNSLYHKTNTVYSLWLARDEIQTDFIYLNGDVLFHRDILKRLLNSSHDTCVAVEKKKVGEEEVKVQLVSNKVIAIGKKQDPMKSIGEFIGIAKFSQKFNELFIKKLDEVVEEGRITDFFEVALDRTLKHNTVYAIDVSDLPCIEVDSHSDFRLAKRIYPKIR